MADTGLLALFLALRLFFFPAGIGELPEIPAIPAGSSAVYEYNGFTLKYCEELKVSEWVAYELTAEEVSEIRARRSSRFYADRTIAEQSAEPDDYKGSGYDRGHLAPAADMRFSEDAMRDCFFMTNIAPQTPALNRGPWADLEKEIREWALRDEALLIVTGPIFLDGEHETIGESKVAVPDFFFKVILDAVSPEKKGIAFIMPNSNLPRKVDSPASDFYAYAVPIDTVEEITGIDFFPWLSEEEHYLEETADVGKFSS